MTQRPNTGEPDDAGSPDEDVRAAASAGASPHLPAPTFPAPSSGSQRSFTAVRRVAGPGLDRVIAVSRRALGLARTVLTAAVIVLALVGLGVAGLLAASGRVHWWLAFGLLALWLVAACYAVRRVALLGFALAGRDAFADQFFEALDLTGAAAKAQQLFGALAGGPGGRNAYAGAAADDSGAGAGTGPASPERSADTEVGGDRDSRRSSRGMVRLLLNFYSLTKVPSQSLDRVRELPLVAPFLPGSLAVTRLWLVVAAALTLACPALAIAAAAAGWGPA